MDLLFMFKVRNISVTTENKLRYTELKPYIKGLTISFFNRKKLIS